VVSTPLIEGEYAVGPRKIGKTSKGPVIYLGKSLAPLIGRRALVIVKILKEEPQHNEPKIKKKKR